MQVHAPTAAARTPITPIPMRTLQRKCACGGSAGVTGTCSECSRKKVIGQPYQTRLRINEPGDAYEQEADRVAARVMEMSERDFVSGVSPAGMLIPARKMRPWPALADPFCVQ